MELEFSTVKDAALDEVNAWLAENAAIRPGFHELVERHDPLVLSSGFEELIRPLLAREGVEVELLANRIDPRPDGWRVALEPRRSRARSAATGASAPACRRRRSSTSATATPTAAPRSPPSASSRAPGWPSTSTRRACRTSRSTTCSTSLRRARASLSRAAACPIPEPYDFALSTERFRRFGPDLANLWHEGGLHRVVGGREVRIEPAPGGVLVEPLDDGDRGRRRDAARRSASTWPRSSASRAAPTPSSPRSSSGCAASGRRSRRTRSRRSSPRSRRSRSRSPRPSRSAAG